MIVTVPAPAAIDPVQLRSELEAAGYVPTSAERDGSRLALTFPEDVRVDPVAVQEIVSAHVPSEVAEMDRLVAKARQVWAGEGTFTQAQAQKILAGLVLLSQR